MRFIALALLFVGLNVSASTIVISDVDDTIRQSNVRALHKFTVLKQIEFSGLSKLYNELAKTVSTFEYVSGVPREVRGVSEFFLYWNSFPQGRLFSRNTQVDDTVAHKTRAIEQIIREVKPTKMLMFGDNGEKDPVIYEAIAKKYPNLTSIYSHQLYDDEIPAGQAIYLTSIDLALTLFSQGHISEQGLSEVLHYAGDKMNSTKKKDREEFFPSWAQCRTFYRNYSRPNVQLRNSLEVIVQDYEMYLRERCS